MAPPDSGLIGRWVAISAGGNGRISGPWLQIDKDHVEGSDGCNSVGFKYDTRGNRFIPGVWGSTLIGCATDHAFTNVFAARMITFRLAHSTLTFATDHGAYGEPGSMVFEKDTILSPSP